MMKHNIWMSYALALSINLPLISSSFANDIHKGKKVEHVEEVKVADDQVKEESPKDKDKDKDKGGISAAQEDKKELDNNGVQSFNAGLSSMITDIMEDESLQEEDQQAEDLND